MATLLSSELIAEKNRISSDESFLIALEIYIPDITEPIRVVSNTEDITWRGVTWLNFPFSIEEITDTNNGEVPSVELQVSNVNRIMESYLQEYDVYVKNNGYAEISVYIYIICTATLDQDTPINQFEFILLSPRTTSEYAIFTLGAANPYRKRAPLNRIYKNSCRFKFKGGRCGYVGTATTCNKTLIRCRELENNTRYGGFLGAGGTGAILV